MNYVDVLLYINDEELNSSNYSLSSSNNMVSLKKTYLNTLTKGTYTITAVFSDGGSATTTFNIVEKADIESSSNTVTNPNTGDSIMNQIILFFTCSIGLTIILKNV